jgi:choline dehydrogenase-like flavoprotein
MIFNSYDEYKAAGFKPRVAIMGSGPAGMTIARELAARSVPVVILEAGSDEYTDESQAFYAGKSDWRPLFRPDNHPTAHDGRGVEPLGRLVPRAGRA